MGRFSLEARIAVVTGASRGLGRYMAEVLAGESATVVLLGRDAKSLSSAANELTERHGRAMLAIPTDVTDPAALDRAAVLTRARFGRVGILVNNAGIASSAALLDTSEEEWSDVLNTNLSGVWRTTKSFAPLMTGHGRIINIGSVMSGRATANRGPYAAAKAGLLNLSRALAIELGPLGITVNSICPSVIVTDLNRGQIAVDASDAYRQMLARVPAGRWGQMDDLAGALLLFASDASAYISGQALYVDGGLTAS